MKTWIVTWTVSVEVEAPSEEDAEMAAMREAEFSFLSHASLESIECVGGAEPEDDDGE